MPFWQEQMDLPLLLGYFCAIQPYIPESVEDDSDRHTPQTLAAEVSIGLEDEAVFYFRFLLFFF